jgi:uncharacterized protein (DUF697 family)
MEKKLDISIIQKALDWSYDKAVNGIPGTTTIQEFANNYLTKHKKVDKAIQSLISWQVSKAGTTGFLTGLGGAITLPVTIPADIATMLYIQIRMVGAIAIMRGYDLQDDQVKTLVLIALTGHSASEIVKNAGIKVGTKMAVNAIKKIPGSAIRAINRRVGFMLLTKFGSKGIINLGKLVPLAGGVIGGVADALETKAIGEFAKTKLFNVTDNKFILV